MPEMLEESRTEVSDSQIQAASEVQICFVVDFLSTLLSLKLTINSLCFKKTNDSNTIF